jgi:hypothetical protein
MAEQRIQISTLDLPSTKQEGYPLYSDVYSVEVSGAWLVNSESSSSSSLSPSNCQVLGDMAYYGFV